MKHYLLTAILLISMPLFSQIGYFDAPYTRYEANDGILINASITNKSYSQALLQSEASDQTCVDLTSASASVAFTVNSVSDGMVVRYSIPDGESAKLYIYINDILEDSINLTSYYAWEYLWSNGNPNNVGVVNTNPRMRFDEVRYIFDSKLPISTTLKLENASGNIHLDFIELETIPSEIPTPTGAVTYVGNGSDLQSFIDNNGGKIIYLPAGTYNVNRELYFGANNTKLQGAGIWHTQINFTNTNSLQGGLRANATDICFSDLYLTTVRNSRSNSYKAINGVFTSNSTINNIWAEHFQCGAWIGQYNTGSISFADSFTVSHCRFRNCYADGINLCKGTRNATVEHCSFRNNGDDDMAIWSADGLECKNNLFQYNTSENCWRASGCAIYGGQSNKAQYLLIKDNLEAGLRVSNTFPGVEFNDIGLHEFSNIKIYNCGTFNDLYYNQVGAIDLKCTNVAGTEVKNIKFSNIDIIDSKNDAIYFGKSSGNGFINIVMENITINTTGKEYPDNDATSKNWGRGYGVLFAGNPSGNGTYCNLNISNRGGNATVDTNPYAIGSFTWTENTSCTSSIKTNTQTYKITTSSNKLKIDNLNQFETISIYDLQGICILKEEVSYAGSFDLPEGVYIVNVSNKFTKVIIP